MLSAVIIPRVFHSTQIDKSGAIDTLLIGSVVTYGGEDEIITSCEKAISSAASW